MKVTIPLLLILVLFAQQAIAQSANNTASTSTGMPFSNNHTNSVDVEGNQIPLKQGLRSFVSSYVVPTIKAGKIARWEQGICPLSVGLKAEMNLAVTVRLKQVAIQVGAPFELKEPCDTNVRIIFTRTPQAVLDDMVKHYSQMLGFHDVSKIKAVTTMAHPIQAWYATETRDNNGILTLDSRDYPFCNGVIGQTDLAQGLKISRQGEPYYTQQAINNYTQDMYQYCGGAHIAGSRLNEGLRSEFNSVTVIADFNKISDFGITAIADYVAMLVLSQTETFEACEETSTIVNVITDSCDASHKPNKLTDDDIAYLTALYKMNPDNSWAAQIADISHQMEDSLKRH